MITMPEGERGGKFSPIGEDRGATTIVRAPRAFTTVDLSYIKVSRNRKYRRALLTALAVDTAHPCCVNCGVSEHRVLQVYPTTGAPNGKFFRNQYAYWNYVLKNPTLYGLICANCALLANAQLINLNRAIKAAVRKAVVLEAQEGAAQAAEDALTSTPDNETAPCTLYTVDEHVDETVGDTEPGTVVHAVVHTDTPTDAPTDPLTAHNPLTPISHLTDEQISQLTDAWADEQAEWAGVGAQANTTDERGDTDYGADLAAGIVPTPDDYKELGRTSGIDDYTSRVPSVDERLASHSQSAEDISTAATRREAAADALLAARAAELMGETDSYTPLGEIEDRITLPRKRRR